MESDYVLYLEHRVHDLERENVRLLANLVEARAKAQANWDCVEDVAIGARLECPSCHKLMPCLCEKQNQ